MPLLNDNAGSTTNLVKDTYLDCVEGYTPMSGYENTPTKISLKIVIGTETSNLKCNNEITHRSSDIKTNK